MAKYDQGAGCPCGLYRECEPGCEHHADYKAPVDPRDAEIARLTARLADQRKGDEAIKSLKLLADWLRAQGVEPHKDESNAAFVGRVLRRDREVLTFYAKDWVHDWAGDATVPCGTMAWAVPPEEIERDAGALARAALEAKP